MDQPDKDGHVQIDLDNIQYLTIKDDELYWRKRKLSTERIERVFFSRAARALGLLVSIASLAIPLIMYLSSLDAICRNTGNRMIGCASISEASKLDQAQALPESRPTPSSDDLRKDD